MGNIRKISGRELRKMLKDRFPPLLIDVRSRRDFRKGHIGGSKNIPIEKFKDTIKKIKPDLNSTIAVYCTCGIKSAEACHILKRMGFKKIYDLGGIDNWHYRLEH
ncbi:rhodanese-like domain-containing protein [Clostridium luticellarii]|jgi:rhodanese-related sulfurtransferase|uniref:Thiosulfate sulfurtransferase PspE n=1 Tax=Clostridium luticellarii TaxID=1691940 RepID=A0A2T0BAW9_9CLOT|nr:rhodanese-like domain-containing protein [Clostridium luticellarii]MCI1945462.1 rhodanese-like domain-containing protein [Clostridium luticellarii]MCI1968795.1 rhodanese-like domain-containing protein [Clostridium luticellarii]MCI1995868.1 rhodanese-like domain-containing protein [Clostridium luticellarii]MCI2040294.1 rhodanese-like domain-containing protein [Clostridium luticellarii]PRR81024.1 Thiosulfate sulfurtransferase PspE precursor [Clostridium luticellarii]